MSNMYYGFVERFLLRYFGHYIDHSVSLAQLNSVSLNTEVWMHLMELRGSGNFLSIDFL